MQAARERPAEGSGDGPDRPEGVLAAPRRWLLFAFVATVALVADQISKILAVRHLTGEPDIEVVGELLQLHLTYNPGAAFSLGTRFTIVLALLATVATVVVLLLSTRVTTRIWAVGLGLLLAGIAGNLIDRLFREPGPLRGHVVDFLMLPNWPIFNIADICINLGVALVLLQIIRGVALDGTRITDNDNNNDNDNDNGSGSDENSGSSNDGKGDEGAVDSESGAHPESSEDVA